MADREWSHAGISRVIDGDSRSVKVPDMVRERGILAARSPVYWSYERVVGIAVVSDSELEKEGYKTIGFRKLQNRDNNYTLVIPSDFFEDHQGQGDPDAADPVPEHARFEPEERVHFMFYEEMVASAPKTCYVFTDEEFNERFEGSDRWGGKLDEVPRFM